MKKILIFFVVVSFVFFAAPASFAYYSNDPVNVVSPLTRPVPEINTSGSNTNYVQYYVQQLFTSPTPVTKLYKINFTVPSSCSVILRNDTWKDTSIYTSYDQVINYNVSSYDLSTGSLIKSENLSSVLDSSLSGYNTRLNFRNGYFIYEPNNVYGDAFGFPIINIPITSSYIYSNNNYQINNNVNDFITWYVPHSDTVIRSKIPQPLSDLHHMYFADDKYLYQLHIADPYIYWYNSVEITNQGIVYNHNEGMYPVVVNFTRYNNNTVQLEFLNYQTIAFNVYLSVYDVVTGVYQYTNTINIPSNTLVTDTPTPVTRTVIVNDADTAGLWYVGLLNADGLNNFDKLKISWSDTIDYSMDFVALQNLLSSILYDVENISNDVSAILTSIQSFYTMITSNWNWLKGTFYDNLNGRWTITNDYLLNIYNLLNQNEEETVTIDSNTDSVSEMEEAKDNLKVTNANGQEINAGEAAEDIFSEALSDINELNQPISKVNELMQNILFNHTKLLLPLIVALALGLLVTIIGKNKSD